MKNSEKEINQRFIEMIDTLERMGLVKNDTDFAKMIEVPQTYISGIRTNAGRNVTVKILEKTIGVFKFISIEWLVTGKGSMQKDSELTIDEFVDYEKGGLNVGLLLNQIKEKDNLIKDLTKALTNLSEKLVKLKVIENPAAVKTTREVITVSMIQQQKQAA